MFNFNFVNKYCSSFNKIKDIESKFYDSSIRVRLEN